MAYELVLFIHSWLRWLVLIAAAVLVAISARGLFSGRSWGSAEKLAGTAFLALFDTQIVLGLLLYFVFSPVTPKSFGDVGTFMHDSVLRFFAVEHLTGMLVAATAAHIGWARAKRATSDKIRFRRVLVGVGIALLVVFASIPWPSRPYGRPLARSM